MIDFGEGISLGPLSHTDFARAWRNDPKIWRWTRQNDLISFRSQERWFEAQDGDAAVKMYFVYVSGETEPIGVCGLTSINLTNRNAEFSLYIAPLHQKEGYGMRALKTLFYHGFINMGLHSIYGETFAGNRASRLFEALGMALEGRRREFVWKDGSFHDQLSYGLLGSDFLAKWGKRSCF